MTRLAQLAPLLTGLTLAGCAAPDRGFVTADDGVRLFYRTIGDGPLDVVIPVGLYLERALAPLAAPERRLVFYDPRGRGRSDAGDRARATLDRQIADLEALRAGLGIDRMVLIGWSGLGMEMAVYTMRHPTRVIRLIQVTPVAARDEPHNQAAYAERARRTDQVALERVRERRERGAFAADPTGYCRALAEITGPASLADSSVIADVPDVCQFPNEQPDSLGPLFEALLGSFAGYDWREAIARVTVPRLVIHGAADAFPVEGSREWVPAGSNAGLLIIERVGHFPFLERPEVFFPAVEAFLRGDWPPGTERS
jgi:pimeloyl-ACP methyl ester carboxylesterase